MKVPNNEQRKFFSFKLKNNIPVIYVKDDKLEKPAFYFAVATGYFSDPENTPGLAHFLEHLIFMGSKKYPKENHFNDVLAKYQGMTNAYTDTDKTVYYFNSLSSGFEEILDIFYNLIKDPLLSSDSQEREVQAVNSEHEKNILNDGWRFYRLLNMLSNDKHPLHKFGTGNDETLNKPEAVEQVKEFHRKYYHSNNFYICLADNKDVKYYKELLNKSFGSLTSKSERNIYRLSKPFPKVSKQIFLESENNNKKIYMVWNMSRMDTNKNPIGLINEITTHMKVKSLQKILVDKDYVKGLGFSIDDIKDDYMIIMLVVNLTDNGVINIEETISIIKQYLSFLSNQNITSLIEDYQKKRLINFDCDSNDDSMTLTSEIIEIMFEDENEPLYYPYDVSNISQIHYQTITSDLLKNPNIILLLPKDKFELTGLSKSNKQKEKYYNMDYYEIDNLDDKEIELFDFELPQINKYLIEPELIENNIVSNLLNENNNFYRFDKKWKTPVVFSSIIVDYPYFENNYLEINQMLLVLAYQIKEYFYDALLLGYNISITPSSSKNILNITVSGYNSKVNDIVTELLEKLRTFDGLERYISMVNREYKQDLQKYKTEQPFSLVSSLLKKSILPNYYTRKELLQEYKPLSIKEFYYLVDRILKGKKNFYQYGNFNKKLSSKNTFKIKIQPNKVAKGIEMKHPNSKETNKAILVSYNLGDYSIKTISIIKTLNTMMSEDFFDVLRTKNQVGYLVKQYYNNMNNTVYLVQHIQTQKDLDQVNKMIKDFNKKYIQELERMSDIEFDKLKENIIKDILQPEQNMEEQYYLDINEILTGKLLFNRKKLIVKEIKKLTLEQTIKFLRGIINKGIVYKVY